MRPAKIHIRPGVCSGFHVSVHVPVSKSSSDLDKNRLVHPLNIGTKSKADFAICYMDVAMKRFISRSQSGRKKNVK